MSDDEFDNIPDEFAGIEDAEWNEILSCPPPFSSRTTQPPTPAVPSPSTSSVYSWDNVDDDVLARLDTLEGELTQRVSGRPLSSLRSGAYHSLAGPQWHTYPHFSRDSHLQGNDISRLSPDQSNTNPPRPLKRSRSGSLPLSIHPVPKKGKAKEIDHQDFWQALSDLEDELTCPICSDLFVATHMANPCGHSFCGDCGWRWKLKGRGCCPICRTELSTKYFMIPNFSMDNAVEKYALALGKSNFAGWEPGGAKYREWKARKVDWQASAIERMKGGQEQKKGIVEPIVIEVD